MKRLILVLIVLGVVGAGVGWFLSGPNPLPASDLASLPAGDATRGERIFWAGGCTSCHAVPKSTGDAQLQLAGGLELNTPFGTFVAPNISSDPQHGIGAWSVQDFANAMLRGLAPDGSHYYPAFPFASYARMRPADIADLYAFMKTLPAVQTDAPDHKLGFPFNIRRGLGLWKLLYLSDDPVIAFPAGTPEPVLKGQYLVEGPGHCGECHTPRAITGGIEKGQWLAGAAAAEGSGFVPNITPHENGLADWSEADLVTFFKDGFTPDFDSPGGAMAEVQRNLARLSAEDQAAIAAYLKSVPPHQDGYTRPD